VEIDAIFEDPNFVAPGEENLFLLKRARKIMNSNLLQYWKKFHD
jgi:hypothetical protein